LFLTDSRQIASVKLDEVARKHVFQFMPWLFWLQTWRVACSIFYMYWLTRNHFYLSQRSALKHSWSISANVTWLFFFLNSLVSRNIFNTDIETINCLSITNKSIFSWKRYQHIYTLKSFSSLW
jgi:hypothetical protein